jgi:hypothetical protein
MQIFVTNGTNEQITQIFIRAIVPSQKVGAGILRQAQSAYPEPGEGCFTPDY